jgi:hypothetical protein
MPVPILTTTSQVKCTHGGTATLITANTKFKIDGSPALLETDIHPVVGCPFTIPPAKPQPCIRIEWTAGAIKCKVDGTKVLIKTSVGKCISAEGAVQGLAIIAQTQMKAKAD